MTPKMTMNEKIEAAKARHLARYPVIATTEEEDEKYAAYVEAEKTKVMAEHAAIAARPEAAKWTCPKCGKNQTECDDSDCGDN